MTLHNASRYEIGMRPPARQQTFPLRDIDAVVVHYSTGDELGHPDPFEWWLNIQQYHMDVRGWSDIGYAYGIHAADPQARILEGRGIGVVAAHSPGWNSRSVSICVLGNDDPGQDVIEPVRERIVRWVQDVYLRLGGRAVPVLGHRQTQDRGYTQCPGDELQRWIDAGMPLEEEEDMPLSDDDINRIASTVESRLAGRIDEMNRRLADVEKDTDYIKHLFPSNMRDVVTELRKHAKP